MMIVGGSVEYGKVFNHRGVKDVSIYMKAEYSYSRLCYVISDGRVQDFEA